MVHVNNWELDVENINGFSRQTFTIMLITGWLTFFLSGALNFGYYLVHPRLELWMLQWIWNCFLLVVWTAPQTTWSTRWPTICVGPRGSCGRPTKVINRKSQIFFQPQCELLTLLDVGGGPEKLLNAWFWSCDDPHNVWKHFQGHWKYLKIWNFGVILESLLQLKRIFDCFKP